MPILHVMKMFFYSNPFMLKACSWLENLQKYLIKYVEFQEQKEILNQLK